MPKPLILVERLISSTNGNNPEIFFVFFAFSEKGFLADKKE